MSTRYVWGKYNSTQSLSNILDQQFDGYALLHADCIHHDGYDYMSAKSGYVYYGDSISLTGNTSGSGNEIVYEVTINNPTILKPVTSGGRGINIPSNNYFATEQTCWVLGTYLANLMETLEQEYGNDEPDYDYIDNINSELYSALLYDSTDDDGEECRRHKYTLCRYATGNVELNFGSSGGGSNLDQDGKNFVYVDASKESFLSYVSSSSSTSYPSDGINGSYWYTRLTSGSIDPTAVSLSSNLVAGSAATITVTPRSNSYGTVSYLYQYAVNGGSWVTIATTSSTSRSFTIPSGTTSIRVRVRAQDNIGFTSTDYVTSSTYTVSSYTTYTSISGAIKGVNPVVAVGGGYVPQKLSSAKAELSRLCKTIKSCISSSHCCSPKSILSLKY